MTAAAPARGVRSGPYDWLAEAALASVTVAVTVGMTRLFLGTAFLRDALALGLASHLVAGAARRAKLSTLAAVLLSGCSIAVTVTVLRYRDTAWLVLPTGDTLRAARDHLVEGWNVANGSSAPVGAVPGLVLVAGGALWVGAFLADTAAFRLRAPASAMAPASGVFVFTTVAGAADGRIRHAALFCATAAAALLALWLRDRRKDAWIELRPGRGTRAMGRAGAAAASLAVLVGAAAGPVLPGAEAAPWVDIAGLDADDGSRVVLSPLVQLRSRLVHSSDRELFTVAVPQESRQYWRLMSLDEFDGNAWRARSQFSDAAGPVASTLDPSAAGPSLVQTMSVTGLGNDYLPAAHELRRVLDNGGVAMEYEASSGALIKALRYSIRGPNRFTYTVESVLPNVNDPDVLRDADTSVLEAGFLAFNTDVPDDVRDLVQAEAERVTAGAGSDYQRALELQDYFWVGGRFRYDLNVAQNHGIDDLEAFLFDVRAGYCEQFASAYAAMARSVGLPTRVAVGFTWGEWDPERGAYAVRGEHAHAWPEVYFAGTGWVRFEPTPGRGGPDDFAVTGRVADQASFDPDVVVAASTDDGSVPEPGPGSGTGAPDAAARSRPDPRTGRPAPEPTPAEAPAAGGAGPVLLGALALAALSLPLGLVPGLRRLRRRRDRARRADDPAGLIELAWADALKALALIRLGSRPCETPLELARRVRSVRSAVGPVDELAALATHGRYARDTPAAMAIRASLVASLVVGACRRQASLRRRLAAALDPSTLVR